MTLEQSGIPAIGKQDTLIFTVESYPIIEDILRQIFGTIRVEVICQHGAAFFGSRDCKWTYSGEYISNDFVGFE